MPPAIQQIPDKNITEGDNLTLTCQVSGIPPPTVYWIKVSSGQRTNGSVLELANINRNESGDYRCEATNECANSSEAVTIDVQCKLKIITLGELPKGTMNKIEWLSLFCCIPYTMA